MINRQIIFCHYIIKFPLFSSMDGFRVTRLEEVVKNIDILITCTGKIENFLRCVTENKLRNTFLTSRSPTVQYKIFTANVLTVN